MADFIFNAAYRSGGKWHLVQGDVEFHTIEAKATRFRPSGRQPDEGDTVRVAPEHVVAYARPRCGVTTDTWRQTKAPIKSGGRAKDDFTQAYRRWRKDMSQDLVITDRFPAPLVVLNAEVPPEPFCGNCARYLEATH